MIISVTKAECELKAEVQIGSSRLQTPPKNNTSLPPLANRPSNWQNLQGLSSCAHVVAWWCEFFPTGFPSAGCLEDSSSVVTSLGITTLVVQTCCGETCNTAFHQVTKKKGLRILFIVQSYYIEKSKQWSLAYMDTNIRYHTQVSSMIFQIIEQIKSP